MEHDQGYAWVYLTRTHNNNWLHKAIMHVRTCLLRFQFHLKVLRVDAGKVENTHQLADRLAESHIVVNSATPEAQYQNFVERFIQTAVRGIATTLLAQQFLDNSFWGMALLAWVRAWNCRPNQASGEFSPAFALTGHHPDINVQFQYPFGSPVSSKIMTSTTTKFKFSPTGELGFIVGNTESANGASLVFFPKKGRNVAFPRVNLQRIHTGTSATAAADLERLMGSLMFTPTDGITLPIGPQTPYPPLATPTAETSAADLDETAILFGDLSHSDVLAPAVSTEPEVDAQEDSPRDLPASEGAVTSERTPPPSDSPMEPAVAPSAEETTDQEGAQPPSPPAADEVPAADAITTTPEAPTVSVDGPAGGTRSKRPWTDESPAATVQKAARVHTDDTPTVSRALKSDHAEQWQDAIITEIMALLAHHTGTRVTLDQIPYGSQILPVKVVLKLKRDSLGDPIKYKARLCVLGNLQRKTLTNVFAPTANEKSLKLLWSLATALRLKIRSIDVYGAFLYPTQKDQVFIVMPTIITGGEPLYWKLNKTMYGLPTSPAAFYEHVSAHLLTGGYHRCPSDPCFFWLRCGADCLFAVVHVDDFAVAASTDALIDDFIKHLEKIYVVSVTDEVNHFLGMHITDLPDGSRLLSQPGLLDKLFDKHEQIKSLNTYPAVPMSSSFDDAVQDDAPLCDTHEYMELLGSLLYIVKTRPDIAYAVSRMAMRSQGATVKDFRALQRILAYLYDTKELGIYLTTQESLQYTLVAWSDASYATHSDGRSHSGYGFTAQDNESGLFYSRSRKQSNITLSSTEAELYAAVEAAKDILWFRDILAEIGLPQEAPTVLYVDNASLITLASAFSGNHKRVKHFLVRLNFLIEQVDNGTLLFAKVHTGKNVVDGLTKPLGPTEMLPKRDGLMGVPSTSRE